jgi:hypothetical protein
LEHGIFGNHVKRASILCMDTKSVFRGSKQDRIQERRSGRKEVAEQNDGHGGRKNDDADSADVAYCHHV